MARAEPELLRGIVSAVEELACTVVWSLKDRDQQLLADSGQRLPKHVHAIAWVPQNDLLAHPALRCMVTQGGTNSISGTDFHGWPAQVLVSHAPALTTG